MNSILDLPLSDVLRSDIALPLQQMLGHYTVGSLLIAWREPRNHRGIEQLFDSPEQAHEAVAVCAAWLGIAPAPSVEFAGKWWPREALPQCQAAKIGDNISDRIDAEFVPQRSPNPSTQLMRLAEALPERRRRKTRRRKNRLPAPPPNGRESFKFDGGQPRK